MNARRTRIRVIWGGTAVLLFFLLWQAGVAARPLGSFFNDSQQSLGNDSTFDVVLFDVDGDGDRDALAANGFVNRLWLNDGLGCFDNSGQMLGSEDSRGVAYADLNGDTYPDVFFANSGADNDVWLNSLAGSFSRIDQTMNPAANSNDVALADVDGDEDVDAVVANNGVNEIWFNDGDGTFTLAQTLTVTDNSLEVALGDVDGNLTIDAYFGNGGAGSHQDELWLNDGNGVFSLSGQPLDLGWNEGAALHDLDGDDDLDIFVADWAGTDRVWLNQGGVQGGSEGEFSDSGQALGTGASTAVALIHVDDDMVVDAVVGKWLQANEIWLNDGAGNFTLSGEVLDAAATYEVAAADVDGDAAADLVSGNFGPNHVWLSGGRCQIVVFDLVTRTNARGQVQYPHVQAGPAQLPFSLRFSPEMDVDVVARIEVAGGVMTDTVTVAAFQTGGELTVADPQPSLSETVTITLGLDSYPPQIDLVPPLSLTFIEADPLTADCPLCFIDWLLKLMGFETEFWRLHHLQLEALTGSSSWNYYQGAFATHGPEMALIVALHPDLLWDTWEILDEWTPAVQAYDNGLGGMTVVEQPLVDKTTDLLARFEAEASPALAGRLQEEKEALGVATMAGLNMEAIIERVLARVDGQIYLPLVSGSTP